METKWIEGCYGSKARRNNGSPPMRKPEQISWKGIKVTKFTVIGSMWLCECDDQKHITDEFNNHIFYWGYAEPLHSHIGLHGKKVTLFDSFGTMINNMKRQGMDIEEK